MALLRSKLTLEQMKLVINPLASSPEMDQWAHQITAGATNEDAKARRLFQTLADRNGGRTPNMVGAMRTAQDVFTAWNATNTSFLCKDYALLYVALARCVGLKAYDVNVEEDAMGGKIPHDCAAVFFGGRAMLVDPIYHWFGAPHNKFTVLNDPQAIALYMGQLPDPECALIASKLAPDILLVQLNFFEKMADQFRFDEAQRVLPTIKTLDTNGVFSDYAEARLRLLEGDPENAISLLHKSIAATPGISSFYASLAQAYAQEGNLEKAHESLQNELNCPMVEAETVYPRKLLAETNELAIWGACCQGIGMMNKSDWDAAIRNFDKVIKVSPNNAEAYFYRGIAKQQEGDSDGAKADFDKAVELNPGLKQNVQTEVRLLDVASRAGLTNGK